MSSTYGWADAEQGMAPEEDPDVRGGGKVAEGARVVKGADYATDEEEPLRHQVPLSLIFPTVKPSQAYACPVEFLFASSMRDYIDTPYGTPTVSPHPNRIIPPQPYHQARVQKKPSFNRTGR
jgi:hypothetical protein